MNPILHFHIFAILVASRDVASQILIGRRSDPLFMLTVCCTTTFLFAFALNIPKWFRKLEERKSVLKEERAPEKKGVSGSPFYSSLGLGSSTLLAFAATFYGIKFIGAPLFSLIEHAMIPVALSVVGGRMFGDRLTLHMKIGLFFCIMGIVFFLSLDVAKLSSEWTTQSIEMYMGVGLALTGAALTAVTSALQKKLVDRGFTASEVLVSRFLIPTFVLIPILPFSDLTGITLETTLPLIALAVFGFAMPLIFMCIGFLKLTLSRFSAYILLIPAYTFLIGIAVITEEAEKAQNLTTLFGVGLILFGYVLFEWDTFKTFKIVSRLKKAFLTRSANGK